MSVATPDDLLIVGTGWLGLRVGEIWKRRHPRASVIGETLTEVRHPELLRAGILPRLRQDPIGPSFPQVLFCVPPSAMDGREEEEAVRAAAQTAAGGSFVLVSSMGVYRESEGEGVREDSATGGSPRSRTLLSVEDAALRVGGSVIRMAGLYERDRGPHRAYLRQDISELRPDGLVNLIHADDAAMLCALALERSPRDGCSARVYLGCDGEPLSRLEIARLVGASTRFVGTGSGSLGKRGDSRRTREVLGWEPRWKSFGQFIRETQGEVRRETPETSP